MKAIIALLLACGTAFAQPLTLVTTSGPGSNQDTVARMVAPMLESSLRRPVVVENRPGANGLIGMRGIAKADTLLVSGFAMAYISKTTEFNAMREFTPLHGLTVSRSMVVVSSSSSVRSIEGLVALHRQKGRLFGASPAPATDAQMRNLDAALGITTEVVGYKQTTQAAMDTATGVADYTIGQYSAAFKGLIDSGRLRNIGWTDALHEQGASNLTVTVWTALFAPASMPPDVRQALAKVIQWVVRSRDFTDALDAKSTGNQPLDADAAAITSMMVNDITYIK